AIDMYRKQKRMSEVPYDELTHCVEDSQADTFESEGDLSSALKQLPLNYSTVLRLKFAQGYSDTEIAELLNITEENVRQRISRGKKKLSQMLAKEGDLE
ncbi:MAG: RNA polymerase sigma factor, partial [Oscillospiraceae bacterium]